MDTNFSLSLDLSDPGDRPPVLLIASTEHITVTHLNGSSIPNLKPLDTNQTIHTLDFYYKEESLCWIAFTNSNRQLWCATMTKFKGFSQMRRVRIGENLESKFRSKWCRNTDHKGLDVAALTKKFALVTMSLLLWTFFHLVVDVEHFAIDWLTRNIYFVDRVSERIYVCNEQDDTCVTVVDLDLQNPGGIALDSLMG